VKKLDTSGEIFLIEQIDLLAGIKDIRKRRKIPVLSNGIYRLYDREGVLLYIGKGKKILNRVFDHMMGRCENTKRFYQQIFRAELHILPFYTEMETEDLEQYLIYILNPKYNRLKWCESTVIGRGDHFSI
jgi:excinuclease UvrABC nuclease subunit